MKLIRRATALTIAALLAAPGVAAADEAVIADQATLDAMLARAFTPSWGNTFAADAIYRHVAAERGWSPETIEANHRFIFAVMERETGGSYCFNLRGGDQVDSQCRVTRSGARSGHYSDSGPMQVNGVHYRNNGWLCRQEGFCSADDIIATPQAGMHAGLAVMERGGKGPWCFSAKTRRSQLCRMDFQHP